VDLSEGGVEGYGAGVGGVGGREMDGYEEERGVVWEGKRAGVGVGGGGRVGEGGGGAG